jgi:hypothetical protein
VRCREAVGVGLEVWSSCVKRSQEARAEGFPEKDNAHAHSGKPYDEKSCKAIYVLSETT